MAERLSGSVLVIVVEASTSENRQKETCKLAVEYITQFSSRDADVINQRERDSIVIVKIYIRSNHSDIISLL